MTYVTICLYEQAFYFGHVSFLMHWAQSGEFNEASYVFRHSHCSVTA